MNLKVDEEYYITSDPHQFILRKKIIVKSGKNQGQESYKDEGYYNTIQRALKKYRHLKIHELEDVNIKELIEKVSEVEAKIDKLCEEAGI